MNKCIVCGKETSRNSLSFCDFGCLKKWYGKVSPVPRSEEEWEEIAEKIESDKAKYQSKSSKAKRKSRMAAYNAVVQGKIKKGKCSICNTTKNVDGHHENYTKPFEVQWLCRKHHALRHSEIHRQNQL